MGREGSGIYKKYYVQEKVKKGKRGKFSARAAQVQWSQWNYARKDFGPVPAFPRQSECLCHSELKTKFSRMNTSGCTIFARMEKASSHCGS